MTMTRLRFRPLWLLLSLTAANVSATPSEPVAADWVLGKLARPAPMRTAFVELRGSRLLKAPLRLEGEYQRPSADTLVRDVRAPYLETTTIVTPKAGVGEVSIARPGKSTRRFALSRAPELIGLQASFGALLAGDRALLEQHYRVVSSGTRAQWTLVLTPKDAALAAKVRDITLRGRGAELRCIETQTLADGKPGELQRTLLAGAARDSTGISDAPALAALCHPAS